MAVSYLLVTLSSAMQIAAFADIIHVCEHVHVFWLTCGLYFVTACGAIFPAIMAVSHAVVSQALGVAAELAEEFDRRLADADAAAASADLVRSGLRLESLVHSSSSRLVGPALALDFAITFYSLTFSLFFSVLSVPALALSSSPRLLPGLFGLACVGWSAFLVLRLNSYLRPGQRATDAFRRARRSLQRIKMEREGGGGGGRGRGKTSSKVNTRQT